MKFNYQARTKTGEIQTGVVEASSREAALSLLRRHGLYVTILEEFKPPFYAKRIKILERISRKDIVVFSRQLSIMFKSKIPPVEALHALSRQTPNPNFREKILEITEEVEGGTPLSKAFARYPKLFNPFYTSMLKSGEAAGKLSESLDYLADHLERDYNLRSKIISAMFYPAFVLFVFSVVVAVMITFVIPQLSEVLKETGQELPLMTKMVLASSDFLKSWGWILLIILFVLIFFIFRYSKTAEGKKFFDEISLKPPIIGPLTKKICLSRFAENLSTLISGGLPIAQALEITGEVVGNDVYKSIILRTRDEVRRGETIGSVLGRYPEVIPPLVTQMTMVGEKTGRLDATLMNIVDFYRKEVDRSLDSLTSLLEPIMVIFMGLLVAGLAISVLMPLYQIGGGLM